MLPCPVGRCIFIKINPEAKVSIATCNNRRKRKKQNKALLFSLTHLIHLL